MARLAPDKKKPGHFEKALSITAIAFSLDSLLLVVLSFGHTFGFLSNDTTALGGRVFFFIIGICFLAYISVVARDIYHMIANKGEYKTLMVDVHILKEEALLAEIRSSEISHDVLRAYTDRIALSIKLLKERSGVFVIISAVFVAFQALSESTGSDLANHFGILLLIGAGVAGFIVIIEVERHERLHHVLRRAVDNNDRSETIPRRRNASKI